MSERLTLSGMRLTVLCLVASAVFPSLSRAQAPVFEIGPAHSSIKFDVKASVNIAGKFDKWDATLTFTSPDETTGVLEINIQAASVDNRKRHEERQTEERRLLRRRAESIDHI
jgi:polyisoprenoid-binding protein YceI